LKYYKAFPLCSEADRFRLIVSGFRIDWGWHSFRISVWIGHFLCVRRERRARNLLSLSRLSLAPLSHLSFSRSLPACPILGEPLASGEGTPSMGANPFAPKLAHAPWPEPGLDWRIFSKLARLWLRGWAWRGSQNENQCIFPLIFYSISRFYSLYCLLNIVYTVRLRREARGDSTPPPFPSGEGTT